MKKIFGRYTVTLSNLNKRLLGDYTKGNIIAYYEQIASRMVPFLKNHPLMMHRFPDGLLGDSFYQKNASSYFPQWIKRVEIPKKGGSYTSVLCQNKATLVYLANQACITPHIWLSRYDKLSIPDRIIFDLDPSKDDFNSVRKIALALKNLFDDVKLTSFAMTSGSKGLHVYLPLRRSADFSTTKAFAKLCAQHIIAQHPKLGTLELRKDKREGKVFIDILRNQQGSTAVAPYALRAKPNAPVATPLYWKEVEDDNLHPQLYTIDNLFTRLQQQKDPWREFFTKGQSITRAYTRLKEMGLFRAPEDLQVP